MSDTYLFAPYSKRVVKDKNIIFIFIPKLKYFKRLFYHILLFFYLLYYCLKLTPDVIYIRYSIFSFIPVLISKIFRIPCVIEINGLLIDEQRVVGCSKLITMITKLSEKFCYKHAKKIVAVTRGIKREIIRMYNIPDEKVVVIENGANTDLFKPIDQKEAKKELKLQDTNYVCFVGSLVPWQGVEYLIQAAPLILKHSDTKFLIVGDGIMKRKLIELTYKIGVADKFIFTGQVPYEDVPKYINASDVCVVYKIPLKSGYSPLKLYEYMACGKPVVASKVEGFEILEQNKAGILVEPENPEELAKVIIKLLKDEKLRKKMGKNGRKYVVKNHSWKAVAKRVVEVCKSVVKCSS